MTKEQVLTLLAEQIAQLEAAEAALNAGPTTWKHNTAMALSTARTALASARSNINASA